MHQADSPEDWERQRAFLAVLRTGSLSAAARELGLAQPTVRRRIEDLEAVTGAVLFTRSPSGLHPTELAHALRDHAETMAMAADAFARAASAPPGEIAGTVRISASEVMAIEVLPTTLAPLLARHDRLAIELSPTNRQEDVLRRETDIAVRMVRPEQQALVARRIGAVPLGVHAHRDYLARHGMPTGFNSDGGHILIGVEHALPILRRLREEGLDVQREQARFRCDNDLAHLAAIRAGLGLGICQVPLAARDQQLVHLLGDAIRFDLDIWLVYHEDLRPLARVRAVYDALADGLSHYIGAPLQRLAPANWPAASTDD
ncbi:MAG: LysR family transcriptional regulator [Sphingomonas sp.]|nr:LysR family transcriptional regulator [Sphingomonas sp.]